jgi:tetratricopeptide (TPR) repeat protein
MNYRALCFVDMPFGQKSDLKSGVVVDFDQIYNDAIKPAIEDCKLEPIRGDEESTGGIIHRAMFARLLLADFVVADLTLANANVFYELGIRHAAKPFTTVPIFASMSGLPFDVGLVRAVSYQLENGRLTKTAAQQLETELAKRLRAAMGVADSPLFQLIPEFPGINLPKVATEAFEGWLRELAEFREKLSTACSQATPHAKRDALLEIQRDLGDLKGARRAMLIELMFSYRDAEAFEEFIVLCEEFPDDLKEHVTMRQQFALVLNRRNRPGDREKALRIIEELVKDRGPDPETLGIKGRIHKDIYKEAAQAKKITAVAALEEAISAYTKGFEADPREYYPGVNAINLLVQKGDPEALKEAERLVPLVSFAVARRGGASSSDYWDLATLLELACIAEDWATAGRVLPKVIYNARASFQTASSIGNLRLLKQARERTGREVTDLEDILKELSARDIELRGEEKAQSEVEQS